MSLLVPAAASANTVTITFPIGSDPSTFHYSNEDVSINQGDSVMWQGDLTHHPLVSDQSLWSTQSTGMSFTFTFATAGTFNFHCAVHATMTGVVRVQATSSSGGGGQPQPGPGQPPPTGGQSPPPGQATDSVAPTVALAAITARSSLRKGVLIRFRSSEAGSAQATLKAKGKTLGTARAAYTAAGVHTIRVRLNKAARALIERTGKLKATLTLMVRDAAGNAAPRLSRTVTLRR